MVKRRKPPTCSVCGERGNSRHHKHNVQPEAVELRWMGGTRFILVKAVKRS